MFESVFQSFCPFKFSQFANCAGASGAAPLSGTGLIRAALTLVRCHVRSYKNLVYESDNEQYHEYGSRIL